MILCLLWERGFDNNDQCMFVSGEGLRTCENWKKVKSICPTAGRISREDKHGYVIGERHYNKEETIKLIDEYKCNH